MLLSRGTSRHCVPTSPPISRASKQRYQVQVPEGFEEAKEVMAEAIQKDMVEDIGGDEQRVDHIDTGYSNATFRHLLLPVWIGAYRFQGKVYQVAVNARTGEVQGERPTARRKSRS